MLYNICKLCHKTADIPVLCLRKYSRKAARVINHEIKNVRKNQSLEEHAVRTETPIIACKRKEFNFYKGQIYPKNSDIPLASKSWNHPKSKGDHFFIHPTQIINDEEDNEERSLTFDDFRLHPAIISQLNELGLVNPLPIQKIGIPKIMCGQNVLLSAETGCGKTLAFLLPMIHQILQWKEFVDRHYNAPLGLIITPTRELAMQIGAEVAKLSKPLGIHSRVFIGGATQKIYRDPPLGEVDIIVATLGVISKLTTYGIYDLQSVKHLVIDEVDAQLHESFEEKLLHFLKKVPLARTTQGDEPATNPTPTQLTLASATVPEVTLKTINKIINAESLDIATSHNLRKILVLQKFMRLGPGQKPMELLKYIKPKVARKQPVIIFSNENSTCSFVAMFLQRNNIETACFNGGMKMVFRQGQYAKYRDGKCFVLSTTDTGSRGLDTTMTQHILNYDFPRDTTDYIHRCGRTGRIGSRKDCRVTNFISNPLEIDVVQKIERAVRRGRPLPIIRPSQSDEEEEEEVEFNDEENYEMVYDDEVQDLDGEYRIPY